MAFIGTPLDTRNTFQSLQGKRFNGDGSTTAFTLDVAPSSVLDIEVFVGNVRQDPNSAYTLSGTTLTFTGAPPSGTNNIYVVHQAKAVGTIDVPTGGVKPENLASNVISGQTLVTLDNSADHVLINDATDGALKKALIPGASFAGIDDQSSSNDDQLTIKDTEVVINEDSDVVDFRVESNGNANMLHVSGDNNIVGIGNEGDLGVGLHIKTADTGASVDADGDELVLEGTGNTGLSILGGTSANVSILFGDSDVNNAGQIYYYNATNSMRFLTNGSEKMRISNDGRMMLNTTSHNDGWLKVTGASNSEWLIKLQANNNTHQTHYMIAFTNLSDSTIGSITTNNNNSTSYSSGSDYRLKENVNYNFDAITRLKDLKPARFNWISDETNTLVDGFIAHEVTPVVPEAITGEKDAVKEDGTIIPQGIDQAKLVPLLTKALQEAITKIETLETEMTALKARVTTLEG